MSLQINKVIALANDVTKGIEQRQNRLLQMYYIPGKLEETEQALDIHQRFRHECEVIFFNFKLVNIKFFKLE